MEWLKITGDNLAEPLILKPIEIDGGRDIIYIPIKPYQDLTYKEQVTADIFRRMTYYSPGNGQDWF
ncbi:MAG: hypothetical protein KJ613_00640 [Nanoarchaeota archaeon]|nr:hypothetical protein [Nanoarchaeota archaeon]